jgi:large subunit ribosomal protein L1
MTKISKKRKDALAKVEKGKKYDLQEAANLVKEITFTKFDASVDLDVRLGVDPRKANQMVRGITTLPHGTGKEVRVLVLCTPDKEQEAKDAGADFVWMTISKNLHQVGLISILSLQCHKLWLKSVN